MFEHDYKAYPELTNTELEVLGFTSPHHQITEDFSALVVKVHDGDTITLRTKDRDFDFPLRFLKINAPELNEEHGEDSKIWLESQILLSEVEIKIDKKNRVDKYGRLLGEVISQGQSMNETSLMNGKSKLFDMRNEGKIPDTLKILSEGTIK